MSLSVPLSPSLFLSVSLCLSLCISVCLSVCLLSVSLCLFSELLFLFVPLPLIVLVTAIEGPWKHLRKDAGMTEVEGRSDWRPRRRSPSNGPTTNSSIHRLYDPPLLSTCLSAYLPSNRCVCLCMLLHVHVFIYVSLPLSLCVLCYVIESWYIFSRIWSLQYVCLSLCLCLWMCVCMHVCMSLCLPACLDSFVSVQWSLY